MPAMRWMAYNVAFWTILALMFAAQFAFRAGPAASHPFAHVLARELALFWPVALLAPAIARIALRYRFAEGDISRSAAAHVVGAIAFVVIGGALMGASEWALPWWRGDATFASATINAIVFFAAIDVLIYVLIVAAVQAAAYARESKDRALREARLEAQLADARLHALSAQLQPHFLFNTLNAIAALVREDPQQAERLVTRLSDLLRHGLKGGGRAEATLEEELSFLEKYIDIQEARFGPRLDVSFEVDPRLLHARVPSLLLQPLVENAIRHGIARRPAGGRVRVTAHRDGDQLRLTVWDDGVGLPHGTPHEGIGLGSTRARLREMYGTRCELALTSDPTHGTVCAIVIPLRLSDGTTVGTPVAATT